LFVEVPTWSSTPQNFPHLISNQAHQNTLTVDRAKVGQKLDATTAISQPLALTELTSPRNYYSVQQTAWPCTLTLHIV